MTFCENADVSHTRAPQVQQKRTFSRSILASAPIRVSRMRLTIHFSPSSRERFSLSERSLEGRISFHDSSANRCHYVRDVYALVYPAVRLGDEVPRVVHEVVAEVPEEEVVRDDRLRLAELLLRGLKVELDVELLEELCDRVLVLVLLHLYDLDDLADRVADARGERARRGLAAKNGGSSEVTKDPWGGGLNSVEVDGGEEGLKEEGAPLWMVEVDEEGPVEEPCAGMELAESRVGVGGRGGG